MATTANLVLGSFNSWWMATTMGQHLLQPSWLLAPCGSILPHMLSTQPPTVCHSWRLWGMYVGLYMCTYCAPELCVKWTSWNKLHNLKMNKLKRHWNKRLKNVHLILVKFVWSMIGNACIVTVWWYYSICTKLCEKSLLACYKYYFFQCQNKGFPTEPYCNTIVSCFHNFFHFNPYSFLAYTLYVLVCLVLSFGI